MQGRIKCCKLEILNCTTFPAHCLSGIHISGMLLPQPLVAEFLFPAFFICSLIFRSEDSTDKGRTWFCINCLVVYAWLKRHRMLLWIWFYKSWCSSPAVACFCSSSNLTPSVTLELFWFEPVARYFYMLNCQKLLCQIKSLWFSTLNQVMKRAEEN